MYDKQGVVGSTILHDKLQYYGNSTNHYHLTLNAGENTLNLQCARLLLRTLNNRKNSTNGGKLYNSKAWLDAYIKFMTTPGTHNDAYAESYHREFFLKYKNGENLENGSGYQSEDIGGFATLPPVLYSVILDYIRNTKVGVNDNVEIPSTVVDEAVQEGVKHVGLTHSGDSMAKYVVIYSRVLLSVVLGKDLKAAIEEIAGPALKVDFKKLAEETEDDVEVIGGKYKPSCDLNGSLPGVFYLAYRYSGDLEKAVLANANLGGDNCHRGAALGALLGAAQPVKGDSKWVSGLYNAKEIGEEVGEFVAL